MEEEEEDEEEQEEEEDEHDAADDVMFRRWGPGVKSGERSGFEKDSGAVKGKAGTGNVKCEGDRDGRLDALGKALSNAFDDAGPASDPLSALAEPPEFRLVTG